MAIGSEVRAWTRLLIPELYKSGITPTSYYNKMVSQGTFYRKSTFLADYRELTGMMKYEKAIRATKQTSAPKKGNIVEMDMRGEHRYRVWADAEYVDVKTGQRETKVISFYSDELKTMEEWSSDFMQWKDTKEYKPDSYISSMQIRAVGHNTSQDY